MIPVFMRKGFLIWLSWPTLLGAELMVSQEIQDSISGAVSETVRVFSNERIKPEELAVTVVDLSDTSIARFGSHRGGERIYPASVVKLFYLVAAHHWMEDGSLKETSELRRAMRDMIADSYNEATHYVIDVVTGTTSGPELSAEAMSEWEGKRNAINRYFASQSYTNINANQKPWEEGPYGRERVFVGEKFTNRNALTTDATARLLTEIALKRAVSSKRSEEMLELMARDPFTPTNDPDSQAHGFIGSAVPKGAKLFSKAGWTSQTRHDAAYIELPGGEKVVIVIFTVNHANERGIIPKLAGMLISDIQKRAYESSKKLGREAAR